MSSTMRVAGNIGGSIDGTGGADLACISAAADDNITDVVVDELPKTSTGKIQKNVVRDKFAGHCSTG